MENMMFLSPTRNMLVVTDLTNGYASGKFEHLSCFLPGLFALGAELLTEAEGMTPKMKQKHMWAAEGLGKSCYQIYEDMQSGLGAEDVNFNGNELVKKPWGAALKAWEASGKGGKPPGVAEVHVKVERAKDRDYSVNNSGYYLRPETLESVFLLWRTTRDPVWRERGWKIFQAIEERCKTKVGYSSVMHVDNVKSISFTDSMPSYFLAETLKYLYLLFLDDEAMPLSQFVFNTEAHPFPVFKWKEWEMKKYGIS